MNYDLIIVGGGPAGISAGIYAARKKIKFLIITDSFGGQSLTSGSIENWIGIKKISGFELAKALEEHLKSQVGVEILEDEKVIKVSKTNFGFLVETNNGKKIETKTVLITSGSKKRELDVKGEYKFKGKGVCYCTTCDAPLFKNKIVAMIGDGNSALDGVVDLLPYASKIYLLVRSNKLKGDAITQERMGKSEKVEIVFNASILEILGESFVEGIKYKDNVSGEEKILEVKGVFVEIGAIPNSELVKNLVDLNEKEEIKVDHKTGASSLIGVWSAGDVSDALYKQNNIAVGDAIKAVLNIYDYLQKIK